MDELLAPLKDPRTYRRILYLLIAFPLGTAYFTILVSALAIGASLVVVVVGIFLLAMTMLLWLVFARVERELTIALLGAKIRPLGLPDPPGLSFVQKITRRAGEAVTWTSLVYVFVEFPFGILSFTAVITLATVSVSLILLPFAYLGTALFFPSANAHINLDLGPLTGGPVFGGRFLATILLGVAGIGLLIASAWALNGLAWLWARFAEITLGLSETRIQLAAAQTEVRTQKNRAEAADKSRRELIVNASHELRTPVASISAHVESLLKPDRTLDDETRKYLGVVATETKRLGSLVDDVLALARADTDELHLVMVPVDVAQVIAQVSDTLAPLARQERNLSLVQSVNPGLPPAMADRDRLAQVLTNLIRNAVNSTPDGGIISVAAEEVGDLVIISVSDTGIGIEAQDLDRIFHRFYRTDQSRSQDSGGSGLGLAIVAELVAAMSGSITAESEPGHGSVFRLTLRKAS